VRCGAALRQHPTGTVVVASRRGKNRRGTPEAAQAVEGLGGGLRPDCSFRRF